MSVRVSSGERIRQAREIRGLTQIELASLVEVEQSHISHVEQSLRDPSQELLGRIALITQFPVAFFKQERGPEFPLGSLLYRRRKGMSSADRDRIRQISGLVFETFQVMSEGFRPFEMRIPRLPATDPIDAAQVTRSAIGLSPDGPVTNLINRLEKNGVCILALPDELQQHDAFSVWADTEPRKPVVVLTGGWSGDRQRFTLSHELGHLVMHRAINGSLAVMDDQADAFASEFLLPAQAMRRDLRAPITLTVLAELKAKWGVSMQALARRAESLDLMSEGQRKYIEKQLVRNGWIRNEPVPISAEKPRLFLKFAESLYGVPVNPAKVAAIKNAPVRLLEGILGAHASHADLVAQAPSLKDQSGPTRVLTFARKSGPRR